MAKFVRLPAKVVRAKVKTIVERIGDPKLSFNATRHHRKYQVRIAGHYGDFPRICYFSEWDMTNKSVDEFVDRIKELIEQHSRYVTFLIMTDINAYVGERPIRHYFPLCDRVV